MTRIELATHHLQLADSSTATCFVGIRAHANFNGSSNLYRANTINCGNYTTF